MPMPHTEAAGHLQAELTARGVRMTHQRRTILGVIETAQQHLDASQILRRVRKLDAGIDRVTVYRTLALLKRQGLVDELDLMHLRGDGHFYERRPQREHLHMACLRCGKIQEFESSLFDRLKGRAGRERARFPLEREESGPPSSFPAGRSGQARGDANGRLAPGCRGRFRHPHMPPMSMPPMSMPSIESIGWAGRSGRA